MGPFSNWSISLPLLNRNMWDLQFQDKCNIIRIEGSFTILFNSNHIWYLCQPLPHVKLPSYELFYYSQVKCVITLGSWRFHIVISHMLPVKSKILYLDRFKKVKGILVFKRHITVESKWYFIEQIPITNWSCHDAK